MLPAEKSREFHCSVCRSRCTRGTDGLEYGHKYRCPERPEGFPKAGLGGSSYYDPDEAATDRGGDR